MPWTKSPILGGFSKSRAPGLGDAESYNLFLELIETKDGGSPGSLLNTAGLDLIGTLGTGPIRGVRDLNDLLYVVSGGAVYSLTPNGIGTLLGQIGNNPGPVSMFANVTQLMIVDGVGGWVVPGGYPLASGTLSAGGNLYAIGDTVTLKGATGTQSAYPIVTITAVADSPATGFNLPSPGTTYSTASNVATTPIQGQAGHGAGLGLNLYVSGGVVTTAAPFGGGLNYVVGDTGTVTGGGGGGCYYRVSSVSTGGVVTGINLLRGGNGYSATTGAATKAEQAVPANVGTGLTLNITAAPGPISASTIAFGGRNYAVGNVGFVSGGTGDATYIVDSVGPHGVVTAFTVTTPGAVNPVPVSFVQLSTSGSGAGFALSAPTFGAFIGIVPVVLPFPKPVKGGVSDGFGVLMFQGSQALASSDQADLATWQPLNYGLADQSSDVCISLEVFHDEVFLFKQRNTEVWKDQGLAGFPFGELQGVHIEYGCAAPFSVAKAGETLLWVSRNDQGQGIVVEAAGYGCKPIATQALIAALDSYANIGDAIGYSFQQGGHVFYVLTFPEANKTWCYDVTTSALAGFPLWHRMAIWNVDTWNRHYGNCFWPWKGTVAVTTTTPYTPKSVEFDGSSIHTPSGLTGLPTSFSTALFSVWLYLPDGGGWGFNWSNQTDDTHGTTNPGLFIQIQNDSTGTPQMTIKAWDTSNAIIVTATYNFTTWSAWVNVMISINTAANVLQVYANTIVGAAAVENNLTPVAITWSSTNPIHAGATQPWHLALG